MSDCNPYEFNPANTDCMITFGAMFTFVCLFVIAGSEKKTSDTSIAMTANTALLDDEGEASEKVADCEEVNENGTLEVKKTAKEMHVFPITRATILF
jgi:hypothetical protein